MIKINNKTKKINYYCPLITQFHKSKNRPPNFPSTPVPI